MIKLILLLLLIVSKLSIGVHRRELIEMPLLDPNQKYFNCAWEYPDCFLGTLPDFYDNSYVDSDDIRVEKFLNSTLSEQCRNLTTVNDCLSAKQCEDHQILLGANMRYAAMLTYMCSHEYRGLQENSDCILNENFRRRYRYCVERAAADCRPQEMLDCMMKAVNNLSPYCEPRVKQLLGDVFLKLASIGQCDAKDKVAQCSGKMDVCDDNYYNSLDAFGRHKTSELRASELARQSQAERCRDFETLLGCILKTKDDVCDSLSYPDDSYSDWNAMYKFNCVSYFKEAEASAHCYFNTKFKDKNMERCMSLYPRSAKTMEECRDQLNDYGKCQTEVADAIINDGGFCREIVGFMWNKLLEDVDLVRRFCYL